ncbi:LCP family protein [Streptomyces sp. SAJ15]|uniref:LCP family protein n=1 Tax=Streptomyces sp. SAJ15 TaxID=2011095 RepID=UPI0011861D24|nr:LCP family protein [Streptomyces sp. SAJ15]TVL88195.1 transcriptional regulator [Streptomyces sp. SAJ15]
MPQDSEVRGARRRRGAPQPETRHHEGGAGAEEGRTAAAAGPGGGGRRADRRKGRSGRKKRGKGVRILRWSALGLAVVILAAAGAGYLYYQHLNSNIRKENLNLGKNKLDKAAPNADGQTPLNILLLGSDSRNSDENVELGGAKDTRGDKPRADVQMLLHVSADRSNMSVISIPRDTRVKIPECVDEDGVVYPETDRLIINASMQHGGPGCTVATWEELTGVPIDHFMMIEFSGVVDMADAVGGVPVCVQENVYDKSSGLRLEKGEKKVKGEQALQWLRTRHGWQGGSDIARSKAQHMYMGSMVRELKSGTKLTDPGKLMDLAEAATKALVVDPGLGTVKKLYDLGDELKKVPSDRITMTTMPWLPDPEQPKAHVVPNPTDAEQLFSMVRADVALDGKDAKKKLKPGKGEKPKDKAAPKDQIPVMVQNGTSTTTLAPVSGRAKVIAEELGRLGFAKATADATPKSQADTTITYPKADQQADAQAVAKALGVPAKSVRISSSVSQVTLVIGSDWREGTGYPKPPAGQEKKEDDKAPETADLLNGGEKGCMPIDPNHRF